MSQPLDWGTESWDDFHITSRHYLLLADIFHSGLIPNFEVSLTLNAAVGLIACPFFSGCQNCSSCSFSRPFSAFYWTLITAIAKLETAYHFVTPFKVYGIILLAMTFTKDCSSPLHQLRNVCAALLSEDIALCVADLLQVF